jgi:hypothetical protein
METVETVETMKPANISNVPLSILVNILADLDIRALKSLRATNRYLRDMMNKPIFWELWYRKVFGEPLNESFTWKDISNLNLEIRNADLIRFSLYLDGNIDEFKETNLQLIRTFFRFKGVDMLNPNVSPLDYLHNYILVHIYSSPRYLVGTTSDVKNTVPGIATKTPSKYLFQKIINILNDIHNEYLDYDIRIEFIKEIVKNIFRPLSQRSISQDFITPATVDRVLLEWSDWMKKMGLDKYLAEHFTLELVDHFIELVNVDNYVMNQGRKFFGKIFER